MLDQHLQALRSMPVNLSLNNSSPTEHQGSKYEGTCLTRDSRGGDGKGGCEAALPLVKTEGQTSIRVSCSGGAYQEEPREQIRMVYEQHSHYDLPLAGYLKDEQRSTPDSTYEDAAEGEVRLDIYRGRWYYFMLFKLGSHLQDFLVPLLAISCFSSLTDVPQESLFRH